MKVTLHVFSGRENPTWHLPEKDAKDFLDRFAQKTVLSADAHQARLGYSGLAVETTTDERLPDGVPSAFFVGGELASGVSEFGHRHPLLSADETSDAAQWLLSKAGKAVANDVAAYVLDEIKTAGKERKSATAEKPAEDLELKNLVQGAACIIANTAYNPGFWNVQPTQANNNCYNYAMNYRSNTFAQPGRKSGHMYTALNCTNVGNAANFDGCTAVCNGSNKLVALVIWPGVDYHWYRRHSEGFWGHKPGQTAARNVDNIGRLINGTTLTPANCNRGPYTNFCGYRYSPTGMVVS